MFKVGDKVRCVDSHTNMYGHIYTCDGMYLDGNGWECLGLEGLPGGYYAHRFELVDDKKESHGLCKVEVTMGCSPRMEMLRKITRFEHIFNEKENEAMQETTTDKIKPGDEVVCIKGCNYFTKGKVYEVQDVSGADNGLLRNKTDSNDLYTPMWVSSHKFIKLIKDIPTEPVPSEKDKIIKEVLDEFDFVKVNFVMDHLNWKWLVNRYSFVPSAYELRCKAAELLSAAYDQCKATNEDSEHSTGGLVASAFVNNFGDSPNLILRFVISESNTFC